MRLRQVATVGPRVPELGPEAAGTEVSFLPLERIWADERFDSRHTVEFSGELQSYNPVAEGDVLVPKVSPTFSHGRVAIAQSLTNRLALATSEVFVVRPHQAATASFLRYRLLAADFRTEGEASLTGVAGLKRVSSDFLRNVRIDRSTWERHRPVADFLDRETERVQATHRQLERGQRLVDEQRSAVVEALTDAPILPLKHTLARIEQGWSPDCEATLADAGAWGVLKAGAPNYATFRPEEHKALPPDVEPAIQLEVQPGDVLMSRANTRELAGSAAVVESTGGWHLMLCDKLYRLVAHTDRYQPHYLVAALASRRVRDQIEMATSGASASMQNITQEVVRALRVPCPSLETQADVESKLAIDWRRRKTLLTHLKTLDERLAEYHDALITEAVTGRLDVTRLSDPQLDESAHAAMEGEPPEVLSA